ncbi:protein TSSC4-like [Argiope bruennichi]|uniref:U5 small nuclear ribonucleoprotein TSSC4 n=1 Tax=Argiope bruennichi TaxID=94029 RepID=A0A8T0FL53_ARGBR|nr:protein TSSC4-like [Argiope bruennichi]XP_055930518.1 protein TSSC4-like [Argiope bruennichi]XP_055930519.1 protein TSSC4-like [Argiope bruennichi]KAF8790948.1 hypothetical protein HNY73_005887 [Argiope bruennichi]
MKKTFAISPHLNKRLISTLMSSKNNNSSENSSFSLKATSEFAARSGDVFGRLQALEQRHETWVSEHETVESYDEPNILDMQEDSEAFKKPLPARQRKRKCSRCQDSDKSGQVSYSFKRPFPVKQESSVPQFKLQPQKWKKYSLEDIPLSSDATNTAVALQFLDEIRQRKQQSESNIADDSKKIVFNKPLHKKQKIAPDSTSDSSPLDSFKSTFTSSQVDSTSNDNEIRNLSVTLTHLEEEEEEEEEEDCYK